MLLLAAAVRHLVPGDTIYCCGLLHLIPVFFFSFKHDLFLMYPLAVLSHVQPRLTYNTFHTSSLMTDMCGGAKAGVSPPRRSPPCIIHHLVLFLVKYSLTSSNTAVPLLMEYQVSFQVTRNRDFSVCTLYPSASFEGPTLPSSTLSMK